MLQEFLHILFLLFLITQVDPYKQNDLPEGDPVIASHLEAFGYVKDKYFWKIEG